MEDGGAAIEAELRRVSGSGPRVGPGGRVAFYRLDGHGPNVAASPEAR